MYSLLYHIAFMIKGNKEVIDNNDIITFIKTVFEQISKKFDVDIIDYEVGKNYIHILISSKPTLDIPLYLSVLKGHSSRYIRKNFNLKEIGEDNFWDDHYFIATTGNVTMDAIMEYIRKNS